jgi:hypothetical protein
MNIVEICKLKYPGQIEAGNINFRQPDDEILIGEWNVPNVERPLEADLLAESDLYEIPYLKKSLQDSCQQYFAKHVEDEAILKQYSSAVSCASYVLSTNPQWKAEAEAFIAWRDAVYAYGISIISDVEGGAAIPTMEQVIAGLPKMNWPS